MTAENNHSSRFDESEYAGASLTRRCQFVYADGDICDIGEKVHDYVRAYWHAVFKDDDELPRQLHQFEAGES